MNTFSSQLHKKYKSIIISRCGVFNYVQYFTQINAVCANDLYFNNRFLFDINLYDKNGKFASDGADSWFDLFSLGTIDNTEL